MPPRVTIIEIEPFQEMLGGVNRCPHVAALRNVRLDPQLDLQRLNEQGVECYVCESTGASKLWLCLHKDCLRIVCADPTNNHSHLHYLSDNAHCLHVNLASLRIWCYQCDREALVSTGVDSDDVEAATGPSSSGPAGSVAVQQPEIRPTGLTGLQNIGNTCYMNAALQALSNCPPLVQHFLSRPPPPHQPHTAPTTPVQPPKQQQQQGAAGDHPQYGSLLRGGGNGGVTPVAPVTQAASVGSGLTRSFHRLMLDVWSPRRTPYVAPTAILYAIRKSHPMFRGFHQHDTQEFLRCLMDQLHEEMKEPNMEPPLQYHRPPSYLSLDTLEQISEGEGGTASSQSEGEEYETCDSGVSERSSLSDETTNATAQPLTRSMSRSPSPTGVELNRLRNSMKQQNHLMSQHGSPSRRKQISYRSIISDVFDGKLISSVQCLTCNRVSTRVETFQDLSLPIPNRDHLNLLHQGSVNTSPTKCTHLYAVDQGWWAWLWDWVCSWFWGPTVSLHDCLAAFFSADELKGDNMYSCEKCNKLRNGVKYSRVLQCPEMLCVHLKRFRHELMFSSKINSYVTFPLEGLDLKPYLHPNCPSEVTTYNLTSVICHHGTAGGGHYTCYALNWHSGRWYEFDDHCVRHVSQETVRNCEAYVLFYRKDGSTMNRYRKRASRLQEMCSTSSSCGDGDGGSGEECTTGGANSSQPIYLVSRRWLDRFNTFAEPGPIDNRGLVCRHGGLIPDSESVLLSEPVWNYLYQKFKGGPICLADQVTPCEQCSERSADTGLLRVQLNEFQRLQGVTHGGMYAIQGSWLCDWESYVKGCTVQPPGPIDNSSYVSQPTTGERAGEDYFEITAGQWELLVKLYGGGPAIPVKEASESDSRSLDERSNCENLDSGCWLPNQVAPDNRPNSREEDIKSAVVVVGGGEEGSPSPPTPPPPPHPTSQTTQAQPSGDTVALTLGTEEDDDTGVLAEGVGGDSTGLHLNPPEMLQ